jgi:hypothetical protein
MARTLEDWERKMTENDKFVGLSRSAIEWSCFAAVHESVHGTPRHFVAMHQCGRYWRRADMLRADWLDAIGS